VGVEATAPHRGGDPAAMLAAGSRPQRVGLTEILRSAPPAEDSGVEMTKIRPAPRPPPPAHPVTSGPGAAAAAPARAASPAPVAAPVAAPVPPPVRMPVPMPAPSPVRAPVLTPRVESAAAPPAPSAGGRYAAVDPASAAADAAAGGDAPALQQLSIGLGLAPDALAGRDPAQATAQLGALARAAVTVLRQLLEQQAQERRQIGSRAPALVPVRELNPLRLAATPQAALLALMAPGADAEAALQRAAAELAAHQKRLMAAFRGAATRLGQEMAPASLAQALGLATADAAGAARTAGAAEQARLWQLYGQLWQGLGLAAGQPWEQGFLEAALMHLAAAYDDPAKP
jgi:predicted component of type VI protein secretion system